MKNNPTPDFKYDETYFANHFASPFYRRYVGLRNKFIHQELMRFAQIGKFLEIGFGDENLIKLFNKDFEVFGLDISEFAVREITRNYRSDHFTICDISKEKIPFNDGFDVIGAINTVEHLSDPEFALKNIYTSLETGGIFLVYMPTQSNLLSRFKYRQFYDVKEHIFRPSVRSLRDLLTRLGFRLVKEYAGSLIPLKISNLSLLQSLNLYFGLWMK